MIKSAPVPMAIVLALTACGAPEDRLGQPVVLADRGEPGAEATAARREFFPVLRRIRRHIDGEDFDGARVLLDEALQSSPPDEVQKVLEQLELACDRGQFIRDNPLRLEVVGPKNPSIWDEDLSLCFWFRNEGEEDIFIPAEDDSLGGFFGLSEDPRSALVTQIRIRTISERGIETSTSSEVFWLEEDLHISSGGYRRIFKRFDMGNAGHGVCWDCEIQASLRPLNVGPEDGESFFVPLEFPVLEFRLFAADHMAVDLPDDRRG